MPCSPERRAANLANSRKSCGPKTAEGKARSRCNGLKHGLTGAGIAIPDEDKARVEDRFESFARDLRPANDVARFLAWQAAMLSVRIERSARQEAASIAREMALAEEYEAEDRAADVDEWILALAKEPVSAVRRLRRTPEGVDWLIRSYDDLKAVCLDPRESIDFRKAFDRAEQLGGQVPNGLKYLELCRNLDAKQVDAEERREYFRTYLKIRVEFEQNQLRALLDGFDPGAMAKDRAEAATRAIFDPSHRATLARRYEATATRDFFRCLKQIEKINRQEDETEKVAPTHIEVEDCAELASSCDEGPAPPEETPEAEPESPKFADYLARAKAEAFADPTFWLPDTPDPADPPRGPSPGR